MNSFWGQVASLPPCCMSEPPPVFPSWAGQQGWSSLHCQLPPLQWDSPVWLQHRDFAPISRGILGLRICGVGTGYLVDWEPHPGSHPGSSCPMKGGKGTVKGSAQPMFLPLLSRIFSVDMMKFLTGNCQCKAHCWNGLVLATTFQSLQGSKDLVL